MHGHDTHQFSRNLFKKLTAKNHEVIPIMPPTRRVISCQLMRLSGQITKGVMYEDFLGDYKQYLLLVFDFSGDAPVIIENPNDGWKLNNGSFFNDYLSDTGNDTLPEVITNTNKAAERLKQNDNPFTILRVNGTESDYVVEMVEKYAEFLK